MAWDVRRLIAASRHLPVRQVRVADIAEVDENHWYAHGRTRPTCRSIVEHCVLIEAADLSYPIILDARGRVMDGMHRVCKALLHHMESLPAVQFDEDPEPDFVGREPESLPYDDPVD